jgi:hypothetical protein
MPFSIYDKLPKSPLPTSPFEFIAKLAEGQKQDLDKVDERIGATKGLFSKLAGAPGHEDWAQSKSEEYNRRLRGLMDIYGNNLLNREFQRDLTNIAADFANDQEVKDIMESKEFVDKFGPTMWQQISAGGILNADNILEYQRDDQGNIIDPNPTFKGNRTKYTFDQFKLTPYGDWIDSSGSLFKELRDQYLQTLNIKKVINPNDGSIDYEQTEVERVFNNPEHRAQVVDAMMGIIFSGQRNDPGFNFLKASAEQMFPTDETAQKNYVQDLLEKRGVSFNLDKTQRRWGITSGGGKSGSGKTPPEDGSKKIGGVTTVALDKPQSSDGSIIRDYTTLHEETRKYEQDINQLLTVASLDMVSGGLFETPGVLRSDAIITNSEGIRQINTELITDKVERSKANDLNATLSNLQLRQTSAKETEAYFMEQAGLDVNRSITEQLDPTILNESEDYGLGFVYSFLRSSTEGRTNFNLSSFETSMLGIPTGITPDPSGFIQETLSTETRSDGRAYVIRTDATVREAFEKYCTVADPAQRKQVIDKMMMMYHDARDKELSEQDPKFGKFTDLVNGYLNSTVYSQAYNYSVPETQRNTIRTLLPAVLGQRKFERATFGPKGGDLEQTIDEDVMSDIIEKSASGDSKEFDNMSVRFDFSTSEYVLDVVYPDAEIGTLEIRGFDQQTLANIVKEQDPKMNNIYLTKRQSILSQLDATNGRRAYFEMPVKDNTEKIISNDRIVVKRAFEGLGNIVTPDNYMFCFKEYPDRVFIAKGEWDMVNMLSAYHEALQTGADETKMKSIIGDLTGLYSITSAMNRDNNIGGLYFPTAASRVSSAKITLDEPGK